MDRKTFEYEGYARIDNVSGAIEIVDPDGTIKDLTNGIMGVLPAVGYRRIRIKAYTMATEEGKTASQIFSMARRR